MGYSGGKLTSLVDPSLGRRATRRMAERGGDQMTRDVAARTPVDTHRTADSWHTIAVEEVAHVGGSAFRSGTQSDSPVARFLDSGVEPHVIKPKRRRALETEAGPRGEVHHPGIHGRHMTAAAAAKLEGTMGEVMAPEAEQWAEETEQKAKRRPGVR